MTDPTTVDRYCDGLLLALRMRDLSGERIGAVLAEVRAHLADSGQDPVEAFGTPTEYADALAADAPPEPLRTRLAATLGASAAFLGIWWVIEAAGALVRGEPAVLGPLPIVVAIVAGIGASWLVDRIVTGSGGGIVLAVLVIPALGVLVAFGRDWWAVTVPALVMLVPGLGLLFAGMLRGVRHARSSAT